MLIYGVNLKEGALIDVLRVFYDFNMSLRE